MWAYPREFKTKESAGQLRKSPCSVGCLLLFSAYAPFLSSQCRAVSEATCNLSSSMPSPTAMFLLPRPLYPIQFLVLDDPNTFLISSLPTLPKFSGIGSLSPILWLTQGYAVLDGPTFPIIGEGEAEANDT